MPQRASMLRVGLPTRMRWTVEADGSEVARHTGWELRLTPFGGSRWKVEARSLGELRSYRRATTVGEQADARELASYLA